MLELRPAIVPSHLSVEERRRFHRPVLTRLLRGPLSSPGPHPVRPIPHQVRIMAIDGGDAFMQTPEDLSGKDDDLILLEYSEEHPPLLNLVDMCSRMNYKLR